MVEGTPDSIHIKKEDRMVWLWKTTWCTMVEKDGVFKKEIIKKKKILPDPVFH